MVLNGTIIGNVQGSRHIELAAKARIQGNVYYSLIEVAIGAEVNGNLVHDKELGNSGNSDKMTNKAPKTANKTAATANSHATSTPKPADTADAKK